MRSATTSAIVRIVRRHFQGRIGQHATETVFERALNDLGQEGCDRLTWWLRLLHARNAGSHIGVQITIKALCEELPFVAEGIVEAGSAQAP